MNKFLWILGASTLAFAVYVVMNEQQGTTATADGIDQAANSIGAWGTKQGLSGAGKLVKGKLEQGVGDLTGNHDTADQGAFDEAAGTLKNVAGQAAQAVSSTIHNIKE